MSEKGVLWGLNDDQLADDNSEDDELPPTYSSLFTEAPLPLPLVHNDMHALAAFEGMNRVSISNIEPANSFVQIMVASVST
jgi:hypothetical protein